MEPHSRETAQAWNSQQTARTALQKFGPSHFHAESDASSLARILAKEDWGTTHRSESKHGSDNEVSEVDAKYLGWTYDWAYSQVVQVEASTDQFALYHFVTSEQKSSKKWQFRDFANR